MYNLLISLGVGIAVTLGIKLSGFQLWAGLIPGTLAFIATFIVLARRVANLLQARMGEVQKELQVQASSQKEALQRLERAVKMLEACLVFDKWQILVGPEIHSQIAMLKYMAKDLEGAQAHFSKGNARNYMAKALEGALYYQRKQPAEMEAAFEAAVKNGKKEPLVWAAYAWCLVQNKEKDKALRVLARGAEANPSDEKIKASLTALQNDKKLKMKAYEPHWWQFGLEQPSPQAMGGRRVQFVQRR